MTSIIAKVTVPEKNGAKSSSVELSPSPCRPPQPVSTSPQSTCSSQQRQRGRYCRPASGGTWTDRVGSGRFVLSDPTVLVFFWFRNGCLVSSHSVGLSHSWLITNYSMVMVIPFMGELFLCLWTSGMILVQNSWKLPHTPMVSWFLMSKSPGFMDFSRWFSHLHSLVTDLPRYPPWICHEYPIKITINEYTSLENPT